MAISEFEIKRCEREMEKFLEARRPPPSIRHELDMGYRIDNQSIEIFSIRPDWQDPNKTMEESHAKTTYVKSKGIWKIFWQRADLKWHSYEPAPAVRHLEEFLEIVKNDQYACFFG
jgi:hypothetical protein